MNTNMNEITVEDPLPKTVCKACCEHLDTFAKFQDVCHETQDKLMNDYLAIVETSTADEDDEFQSHEILDSLVEDNDTCLSELATEIEIYADGTKQISTLNSDAQQRSDILTLSLSEVYNESPELADTSERVIVLNSSNPSDEQPNSKCLPTSIPTYVVIRNEGGPITLVPINALQTSLSNHKPPANKVPIPRLTKENRFDPAVYALLSEENTEAIKPSEVKAKPKRRKGVATKVIRVPASKRVRKLVQKVSNTEYRCVLCGATFPQNYLCEYHVRSHTGEMPFTCSACGKNFVAMHMLTKHKQSHEEGFRHLCNTCGRGFRSMGNLRCHERMHLDVPAPFACGVCGKSFYFRASYNGHVETHKTRRDHTCDRCAKNYKTSRHLKEHVARVHEGVTRHTCPTCGKGFYRHTTFRQHMRLHTAERPYPCDVCGRAFNERTNLRRHKRIHDKKKLFNTTYLEVEVETVIESDEPSSTAKS